jgi:hypothetical protein
MMTNSMQPFEQAGHRLDLGEYLALRPTLHGWFDGLDALVFQCFDRSQWESGVRGDLLEIGAYHGKSAALFGYFVREGERLVVCDLFDSPPPSSSNAEENQRFYADLSRQAFEDTFLRFHRCLPEVVQCSSIDLRGRAGLQRSFRLIHIDGSHLYEVVRQDIATAQALLVKGGIVVFDDYRWEHTPGVAAAVWEAVATRAIRPICITASKMYAGCGETSPAVLAALDSLVGANAHLRMESHSLLGTDLARIFVPPSPPPARAKQLYSALLARLRRTRRHPARPLFLFRPRP